MLFYSTNGKSKPVDFKTALLRGLAEDGGLYMPNELGNFQFSISNFQFWKILKNFIDIPEKDLEKICAEAFNFPVPLVRISKDIHVLELFHGRTLSFKDFGARFMARVMDYYMRIKNQELGIKEKLNIVVATSGDTGSAVANGFYGLSNIKVFVLYPSKRVSELQEKQMTTLGKNIVALEVQGDFDDCQRLAKQALADSNLRKEKNLSSANSINIGRLLPQMFYYFEGVKQLGKQAVFVVPSGNFGNLTAGLFAKNLGLPIERFIAAVNINSAIPRFLESGKMEIRKTRLTLSNAMDVGSPSNWARIADLYEGNREKIQKDISAVTISEEETHETIKKVYQEFGYIADPHTAVGLAAAMKDTSRSPKIVLATAHPAKFKETVEEAIGSKISLPPALSKLRGKTKKSIVIGKNYSELYLQLTTNN
ncbi:MAG: threonine synthase [Parcubacteria group bacterium Gr01-1014_3]|nr:MAG: threonine synthase [Parcubacteria group bacterium Gr01-1014_3]